MQSVIQNSGGMGGPGGRYGLASAGEMRSRALDDQQRPIMVQGGGGGGDPNADRKRLLYNQIARQPFTTYGQYGAPQVSAKPIWDEQQIQQHVGAVQAGNDAQTAGSNANLAQRMASMGYAAGSPQMLAMQGQASAANLGANTANERETRMGMAQANAGHVLDAQKTNAGNQVAIAGVNADLQRNNLLAQNQRNQWLMSLLG